MIKLNFRITEEMKKRMFVYGGSLSIAVLIAMFFLFFDRVVDFIQFILSIGSPFLLGIFLAFLLHKPSKWFERKLGSLTAIFINELHFSA